MPSELVMARQALNTPAFASTLTPDPERESAIKVTQTGNITIANPASARLGAELTLILIQDNTGSRTITLGNAYKASVTFDGTASKANVIRFWCDGTNWWQIAASTAVA